MNFLFFFEVDITGVCAAICLGVDTPQVTPLNPHTGGGHIARRLSFCCCATYYWSLSWLDWRLGVHIMIGSVATPHEYQDSPFSPGITFTIPTCSLQSLMCLGTHSILQHIIMYISTHLYIYLHASYSHIHVTKPRTCNNTTNM